VNSNVIGRVRNITLPNSKGLLPLFEAIINSIDAIEDAEKNLDEGFIKVKILRSSKSMLNEENENDSRVLSQIIGFEVTDNGIGFTGPNYEAFNESDTLYKQKRGGKGVGRFLWLKAFDKVEIDSTFRDGGKTWQRTFVFSLANPSGIRDHSLVEISDDSEIRTVVRLDGFKTLYQENIPRSATSIAQRIVEHCLEYFILGNMPSVQVFDDSEDAPILLERLYESLVSENKSESIEIKGRKFDIVHLLLNAHADLKHQVYYCGDHRVVLAEKVSNLIPNLKSTLSKPGNDGSFVYSGYVSSDYLDKHADQQRTGFDTMSEDGSLFSEELKWSEITENVLAASKAFLQPYTEEVKVRKEEEIKNYANSEAPEYRYIVANYPEKLDKIPPDFSKRELDLKLHEIHREIEEKFIDETGELLEEETLDEEYIEEQFSRWLQDWNDVGKANLAKYIVHRKSVLTILEKILKVQNTGRYAYPPEADNDGNEWKRSSLSISTSNTLRIGKLTECNAKKCYDWIPNSAYHNTAGGGPLFVDNSERIGGTNSVRPCRNEKLSTWYCNTSFKWTAVGMTQDGRYLIVVVSDIDKTMDQAAAVLIAEGAWKAIKLDGGGSTQVWFKSANLQSIIGGGRPVANAILVFSSP